MDGKKIVLPQSKLSSALLKKRVEKDLSQRDMAKEIGISYPVYAGLERGNYTPSLKLLTKIAQYLDMDVKQALDLYMNN
jgi:DNA-binding XRE family transcriptional regulator